MAERAALIGGTAPTANRRAEVNQYVQPSKPGIRIKLSDQMNAMSGWGEPFKDGGGDPINNGWGTVENDPGETPTNPWCKLSYRNPTETWSITRGLDTPCGNCNWVSADKTKVISWMGEDGNTIESPTKSRPFHPLVANNTYANGGQVDSHINGGFWEFTDHLQGSGYDGSFTTSAFYVNCITTAFASQFDLIWDVDCGHTFYPSFEASDGNGHDALLYSPVSSPVNPKSRLWEEDLWVAKRSPYIWKDGEILAAATDPSSPPEQTYYILGACITTETNLDPDPDRDWIVAVFGIPNTNCEILAYRPVALTHAEGTELWDGWFAKKYYRPAKVSRYNHHGWRFNADGDQGRCLFGVPTFPRDADTNEYFDAPVGAKSTAKTSMIELVADFAINTRIGDVTKGRIELLTDWPGLWENLGETPPDPGDWQLDPVANNTTLDFLTLPPNAGTVDMTICVDYEGDTPVYLIGSLLEATATRTFNTDIDMTTVYTDRHSYSIEGGTRDGQTLFDSGTNTRTVTEGISDYHPGTIFPIPANPTAYGSQQYLQILNDAEVCIPLAVDLRYGVFVYQWADNQASLSGESAAQTNMSYCSAGIKYWHPEHLTQTIATFPVAAMADPDFGAGNICIDYYESYHPDPIFNEYVGSYADDDADLYQPYPFESTQGTVRGYYSRNTLTDACCPGGNGTSMPRNAAGHTWFHIRSDIYDKQPLCFCVDPNGTNEFVFSAPVHLMSSIAYKDGNYYEPYSNYDIGFYSNEDWEDTDRVFYGSKDNDLSNTVNPYFQIKYTFRVDSIGLV